MFYADYHMHTKFSSDSDASMSSMVERAVQLGLKEIAITDHVDFDYPDPDFPFQIDYKKYAASIQNMKERYGDKISIKIGVEMGLQPYLKDEIEEFCQENYFDFIIGSSHCVDKKELFGFDFFRGKSKEEAFHRYFESVLENIELFDCFHVYGHVDYINRYSPYEDKDLRYEDYSEIIDEILKTVIRKEKGLEINTSGFKYGLGQTHPQQAILERYHELGGRIITVGSDSHNPESIAGYFDAAYDALEDAGFEEITLFQNRKPVFVPLSQIK